MLQVQDTEHTQAHSPLTLRGPRDSPIDRRRVKLAYIIYIAGVISNCLSAPISFCNLSQHVLANESFVIVTVTRTVGYMQYVRASELEVYYMDTQRYNVLLPR